MIAKVKKANRARGGFAPGMTAAFGRNSSHIIAQFGLVKQNRLHRVVISTIHVSWIWILLRTSMMNLKQLLDAWNRLTTWT